MKIKDIKICGYAFQILTLPSGWITAQAPMGKGDDKKMFDTLVYYNQSLQHGKSQKEVVNKVKKFIAGYKEKHCKHLTRVLFGNPKKTIWGYECEACGKCV